MTADEKYRKAVQRLCDAVERDSLRVYSDRCDFESWNTIAEAERALGEDRSDVEREIGLGFYRITDEHRQLAKEVLETLREREAEQLERN